MQAAIAILETALCALEINAPINESEGNLAQAKLECENAQEIREALEWLRYKAVLRNTMQGCCDADSFALDLAHKLNVDVRVKPHEMFSDYV